MAFPILAAKLHKPVLPDSTITRGNLLDNSLWASMILVSAQAGAGKSTAVSAWLSEQDRAYCWYSLDDWDNDLMQFFAYLAEGLASIDKQVSDTINQMLDAYQSIGYEAFTKALINELHTAKAPFILVFDDYHLIRNEQIHQLLRAVLEHFPPAMQLVLITREDPPFPLARIRAGKKLLEVRISELKFTEVETKTYFSRHLSRPLTEEQLQLIFRRTEGWIAGIQMAALSMQGLEDIAGFIEAFSGSHYYVMDYLMEEVLERQSPESKAFLLQTSILDAFSGELCDAVLACEAGTCGAIIEKLVKTNSFIISTDPSRQWFRYHHLFRDLLRQRLERQPKITLDSLHCKAALWFKAKGREQEAIQHLLNANALEEAAALIECKWAEMDMRLQSASWLDLAKKLPVTIVERSPVLAMGFGWALLDKGDVQACQGWLTKALELYDIYQTGEQPERILAYDTEQLALLPATVSSAYAYIAAAMGDVEGTFTHARYALAHTPADQYSKRSVVEILLSLAHWKQGDLNGAEAVLVRSFHNIQKTSNPLIENSYYLVLGELYIQQGSLQKAKAVFEQTIARLAKDYFTAILLPGLFLGLAKIAFLQGDNGQASALLVESNAHGQRYALMDWKYKYYLLRARMYCSEGLYDLARDCIRESSVNYYINPIPEDLSIDDVSRQIDMARVQHRPDKATIAKNIDKPSFNRERANQALPEPLTVRELEVLSLIVSGLSNQEICNTLFLALSTVKGYNQNIFSKLEVNRRTQAIYKAKVMGLI